MSIRTIDVPDRFIRCFNFLASTKGGTVDDVKAESYYQTLGTLSIEAVEEAARRLCQQPTQFLPSAGEWFQQAKAIANSTWKLSSEKATLQLAESRDPEQEEKDAIRQARSDFLDAIEKMGYPLNREVWEKRPIVVPTYGCVVCKDTGWKYHEKENVVSRCACLHTNPVLERRRADAADRKSRSVKLSGGTSADVAVQRGSSSP
jgi:hypothetical protein